MVGMAKFLIFPLFLVAIATAACPDGSLYPCECIDNDDLVELECNGKEVTLDNIKYGLNALDKKIEAILLLEGVNLGSVPHDFFAGFNIVKMELESCTVESFTDGGDLPFTGLENVLRELEIVSSINEDFKDTKFQINHLKVLTDFEVTGNEVDEVPNEWFEIPPPLLTRLALNDNGIQKLGDRAFANLNRLMSLELKGNRFGSISRSMLPSAPVYLEEIELDNNALTSIPQDIFSNMPALNKVSLRSNGLTKVEENTFGEIWTKLESLDLRGNPLECDSHIDWIIGRKTEAQLYGRCNSPQDRKDLKLQDLVNQ